MPEVTVRLTRTQQRMVARRAAADGLTLAEWLELGLQVPALMRSDDTVERRRTIRSYRALRRHGWVPRVAKG